MFTITFGSFILDYIWDGFVNVLENIFNEFAEYFAVNMAESMEIGLEMIKFTFVQNVIQYSQAVAYSLVILFTAYHAVISYILWKEGNPEGNPSELIKRAVFGVALISTVPWLVKEVYSFGTYLAIDIAQKAAFDFSSASPDIIFTFADRGIFAFTIGGLVCLIMWLIIIIQSYIRAAEIVFLAVSGPMLMVRGFSELSGHWWKNLVSISITQALVIIMVKLAIVAVTHFTTIGGANELLLLIGILWVAIKTPSTVKEYAYSTGVGRVITGATQSVGSYYLMRKAFTRGV